MHHRAPPQPRDQLGSVGGSEHVAERVVLARALETFPLGYEVQVVVAENHDRALIQVSCEAQHLEGFRTAVDEIADEPPAIAFLETGLIQELPQLIEASLHVADRVRRHRRRLEQAGRAGKLQDLCITGARAGTKNVVVGIETIWSITSSM